MDPSPPSPTRGGLRSYNFAERVRRGDTYGLLLVLLLLGYLLVALLEDTKWNRLVFTVTGAVILLLALHTSHVRGPLMRFACVCASGAVVVGLAQLLVSPTHPIRVGSYVIFVLLAIAPVVIVVRIVEHPVVSAETILGALCAYLLLGIIFAGLYRAADELWGPPFFIQTSDPTTVEYIYFSFVTLTTVGFGDLTPATDGGRVLASLEALLGQVFLVTIVATLVGSYGRQRPRARPHHDEADTSSNQEAEP